MITALQVKKLGHLQLKALKKKNLKGPPTSLLATPKRNQQILSQLRQRTPATSRRSTNTPAATLYAATLLKFVLLTN